jgi:hypothetical protein
MGNRDAFDKSLAVEKPGEPRVVIRSGSSQASREDKDKAQDA